MKESISKILSLAIVSITILSSCGINAEKDDTTLIKEEIESSIMEKINDPESYSFVEMQIIDTVYYSSIFEFLSESYDESIERSISMAEMFNQTYTNLTDEMDSDAQKIMQSYLDSYKDDIKEQNELTREAEQFKKNVEILSKDFPEDSTYLNILFSYRQNNEFGARVLVTNEYEVGFDKGVKIIWSGEKKYLDECKSSFVNLTEFQGESWDKCLDAFKNTIRSQLRRKIER